MSLLHVRQIETHLRDSYSQDAWNPSLDDRHNLSRLLARFAIDLSLGKRAQDGSSLIEITDAPDDRGIDAIAVDPVASLVVVAQSKWRDDGTGSVDLGSVLKFLDGVRALLDLGDPTSNADPSANGTTGTTKTAVRTAMQTPGGRLRMLLATTAAHDLADEVKAPIEDLLRVLNDVGDDGQIAEFSYLGQSVLFNSLAEPYLVLRLTSSCSCWIGGRSRSLYWPTTAEPAHWPWRSGSRGTDPRSSPTTSGSCSQSLRSTKAF